MQNYFSIQFLWVVKSLWLTSKKIPLSMRLLVLFKGVCRSLHFCFKVNQSIYFYFTLFIFYIRRIKITPTDLRRKLEIFQNTFKALISKRTSKCNERQTPLNKNIREDIGVSSRMEIGKSF